MPSIEAVKPKYDVISGPKVTEKIYYHNRRISKDKGTDTEKDAEKENKKKEKEIETGKKPVPKDEVAKKEEVTLVLMFLPSISPLLQFPNSDSAYIS